MANAAELLYGFVLHSMVRGYPLAQHTRLRTSSRSDQGLSVAIGHGKTGYYINYGRQDWGADDLGVSSVLESDAATV
jgi:hypothetical protein